MKEKKGPMIRTDKKKITKANKRQANIWRSKADQQRQRNERHFFWWAGWSAVDGESGWEARACVCAWHLHGWLPCSLAWDPLSHIYVHIECSQVLSLDSRSSLKGQQLNKTDILTEHLPACGGIWLWFLIDICPNRQTRVWDEKQTIGFPWLLLLECICSLNEMPGCWAELCGWYWCCDWEHQGFGTFGWWKIVPLWASPEWTCWPPGARRYGQSQSWPQNGHDSSLLLLAESSEWERDMLANSIWYHCFNKKLQDYPNLWCFSVFININVYFRASCTVGSIIQ